MLDKLNKKQRSICEDIIEEVNSVLNNIFETRRIFNIIGPAGSGKTYLTGVLVQQLKNINLNDRVISISGSTPTHKAVSVLKGMINDEDIECRTIHSFLKLKIKKDYKTGKEILEQDSRNSITPVDILVVDESSMINQELFDIILDNIKSRKIKVCIFIGDDCQLKSIDGIDNPVYKLKAPYKLTEIVRQAKDNPIIKLSVKIRSYIETNGYISEYNLKQIFAERESLNINLTSDFNSWFKAYVKNKDDALICAFKNETVKEYNNIARIIHKGQNLPYIINDEDLVFLEAHVQGDDIIHMNNEVITVKSSVLEYDEERGVYFWSILDNKNKMFRTIDSQSKGKWEYRLREIANKAKNSEGKDKSLMWKYYFNEKEYYQKVTYAYASTLHKSQGSSITNVFIDLNEVIEAIRYTDLDTVLRLLYVGVTRAKENLFLYLKN